MTVEIVRADYDEPQHAKALVELLDRYAQDKMGGGEPLSRYVKENLVDHLARFPGAFSVLAFVDGMPAGLINCFMGFSTFACKPLVNIHDVTVNQEYRGLGISQKLLRAVENIAREKGCCKMTMEVLEGNLVAKKAYEKFGFASYELDPETGRALFWQKKLDC